MTEAEFIERIEQCKTLSELEEVVVLDPKISRKDARDMIDAVIRVTKADRKKLAALIKSYC